MFALRSGLVILGVPTRIFSVVVSAVVLLLVGCGSGGSPASTFDTPSEPTSPVDPAEPPDPSDPAEPADPGDPSAPPDDCDASFSGTFDAIEEVVFARYGCAEEACHGSAAAGDLDLRPGVAHANLLEVPSQGSSFPLIKPGDNDRSYLWLKLAAKTDPDSVSVGGAPMPVGDAALSADELQLVRQWIKAGAPAEGTVEETVGLIDGCLPPLEPIVIKPLEPPPSGEGVQLVMPEYLLPAASEQEVCFAQYYDLTDQVPAEFQNPEGTHFRISVSDLRQDPQSHHLILIDGGDDSLRAGYGDFFCTGGSRHGESCEPTDLDFCGAGGACATLPVAGVACGGVGPGVLGMAGRGGFLLVAQQSNEFQELVDGVYAEIPIRGFWLWNSHAFNLSIQDTTMHARINYTFATDQRRVVQRIFDPSAIFGQSTPPYGSETICQSHTFPRGARVFNLIAHTHKRGKRFWVNAPDGSQIYESAVYNDPTNQYYDPALAFDSADPAERTITFCAYYENGVAPDGSPDPSTVKRRSTTPDNAVVACSPVACTAGNIGAACSGADDDASCDSSPGAGDGECDACVLGGGLTTEDEMFLLMGAMYVETDED